MPAGNQLFDVAQHYPERRVLFLSHFFCPKALGTLNGNRDRFSKVRIVFAFWSEWESVMKENILSIIMPHNSLEDILFFRKATRKLNSIPSMLPVQNRTNWHSIWNVLCPYRCLETPWLLQLIEKKLQQNFVLSELSSFLPFHLSHLLSPCSIHCTFISLPFLTPLPPPPPSKNKTEKTYACDPGQKNWDSHASQTGGSGQKKKRVGSMWIF